MTPKKWKNGPQKLLIIGPDPFISQSSPDQWPTAQNWFSILWNLGTRHLFSYLCSAAIYCIWILLSSTAFKFFNRILSEKAILEEFHMKSAAIYYFKISQPNSTINYFQEKKYQQYILCNILKNSNLKIWNCIISNEC